MAPHNLAVHCTRDRVPDGAQVGTVDRLQGRQAPVLAILLHSPRLLDADCPTLEAMALVDGVCQFVEMAGRLHDGPGQLQIAPRAAKRLELL